MARLFVRVLVTGCMVMGLEVAAQPECRQRVGPWESRRTSVSFLKGHAYQAPPTVHVAGGIATTLVFNGVDLASARLAGETGEAAGRFRVLDVGVHTVVIVPAHNLAAGESFTLNVTLKDGTAIPFNLVTPLSNQSSDGQVDVLLGEEDALGVRNALNLSTQRVDELKLEVQRHRKEEVSVDGALGALLAQEKVELTPFAPRTIQKVREDGAEVEVTWYRNRKRDLGKAAVVFKVTNRDEWPWEFDEIRLLTLPSMQARPFTMRASSSFLAPGDTARFAVVIPTESPMSGPDGDRFALELWRAGVGRSTRQAAIELVVAEDGAAPLKVRERTQDR